MIREYTENDAWAARLIFDMNGLPDGCFPDLDNKLFVIKAVLEVDGEICQMAFLKATSEVYLLLDHSKGTAEKRIVWLHQFTAWMREHAKRIGYDQITAFVPPEIEASFAKRLEELGFVKSAFIPYTLNL